jgi:hypothetical protein
MSLLDHTVRINFLDTAISALLREELFPGNQEAFRDLQEAIATHSVLIFTGAGTSAPDIPTWSGILSSLINDAVTAGVLTLSDATELRKQLDADPLEVASAVEEAFTPRNFRAKLADRFDKPDLCTDKHEMLMELPASTFVTLNYDSGLSTAFARRFKAAPEIIQPHDTFQITRWRQNRKDREQLPAIIHWHGKGSSPNQMVFTAEDYDRLYSDGPTIGFLEELWRNHQVLAVGFGFTDPFLTRVVEKTLRPIESDNRHFAFIGHRSTDPTGARVRRTFAKKYRLSPVFYEIKVDAETGYEDHSDLCQLIAALRQAGNTPSPPGGSGPLDSPTPSAAVTISDDAAHSEFVRDLLVAPNGRQLYVEPRLYEPASISVDDIEAQLKPLDVEAIVNSPRSVVVTAPHEYGLTSLGRRLVYEFSRMGMKAHIRDAHQLPEYKAKLEKDPAFAPNATGPLGVLILDNFSFQNNERLLKEVTGLKRFCRIIILAKTSNSSAQIEDARMADFDVVLLSHIERGDIRTLASQMYGSSDDDLMSAAVEKVYNDLLDLCIPLTPANVVMYLSVIFKEGDFIPLNRLQIIDRYVRELLRRPSDPYRDSFNVDNKLDVISLFVHRLYERQNVTFTRSEWAAFCDEYMRTSLVSFDEAGLIADLSASRVLGHTGSSYYFKYKLFYSFFLGRYVANRAEAQKAFLATNNHMKVDGLVEVISGLSADNTALVEDLCSKLEGALATFQEQYGLGQMDPYLPLEWTLSAEEEEKTWNSVTARLAAGPAQTGEVDRLKRSFLAEKRTEDQAVVIQNFTELEQSISHIQMVLTAAIANAVDIDGRLKTRAMKAIIGAYFVAFQVAFIFAPIIASRKYFVWNGIAFVNRLSYDADELDDLDRQTAKVLGVLPRSLADHAAREMGLKKLGQVHAYLATKGELTGFARLINFAMVLRSKPNDWTQIVEKVVGDCEYNALYLRYMLSVALSQFHQDVNTNHERGQLKRVVAMIKSKRQLKKAVPSSKIVTHFVKELDRRKFFRDI